MSPVENILTYRVIIEPATEGGYVAFVPSLPGCMTQGETFEEIKENIKDAISGYVAILKEQGEEIPREPVDQIAATVSVAMLP